MRYAQERYKQRKPTNAEAIEVFDKFAVFEADDLLDGTIEHGALP
jgi:hypothetical protein